MIEVKNLHKSFGEQAVLKDISVVFEKGKTNLIIGQSGSGKTVLLKCIVGLHQIDAGDIIYGGDIYFNKLNFKERKNIRKQMGMLFQGSALFDSSTVLENVMYPLQMFTDLSEKDKVKRANECLERVDITHANDLFPGELSGGMQKRVAIARAISLNPMYLFCDEPNSGLDPRTAILIDNLIAEITQEFNMTTIINTHDMNSVMEIGDNIVYIYQGENEWKGSKNEIFSATNDHLNEFVFASNLTKKIKDNMQ